MASTELPIHDFAAQWTNIGIQLVLLYTIAWVALWMWRNNGRITQSAKWAGVGLLAFSVGLLERIGYWTIAIWTAPVGESYFRCDHTLSTCEPFTVSFASWAQEWRVILPFGMIAIVVGLNILIATLRGSGCRSAYKISLAMIAGSALLTWLTL